MNKLKKKIFLCKHMGPDKKNDVSNVPFGCPKATGQPANDCHEAWYGVLSQALYTHCVKAKKALMRKPVRYP